jgi:Abortive infection alpha
MVKITIPGQIEAEINEADYGFLQKIANSNFVGLIGGDWIQLWRWNNLTKIAEKVRKKCEELRLDPQLVAPKFIKEFFESASLEEDDAIQEMWANLLVNKSVGQDVNIHYLNVLKSLEPKEGRLLNALFQQSNGSNDTEFVFTSILGVFFEYDDTSLRVMIHKLYGFNILRPPLMRGIGMGGPNGIYAPAVETTDLFRFSEMGLDFCKKCTGVGT